MLSSITQLKGMKMVQFCLLEALIIVSIICLHIRYKSEISTLVLCILT